MGDMALDDLALSDMALHGLACGGFGVLRLVVLGRELGRPSFVDALDSLAQLLWAVLFGCFAVVRFIAPDDRAGEREGGQSLDRACRDGAHGLADLRRQIVQ